MEKKEIKTFTEQDMVEFAEWAVRRDWEKISVVFEKSTKELFQLWEEQRVPAINSTSELGCMLDTERVWIEIPQLPKFELPKHQNDVEVRLKDGKETIGFYAIHSLCWYISNHRFPNTFDAALKSNPVVAWRDLVTEK